MREGISYGSAPNVNIIEEEKMILLSMWNRNILGFRSPVLIATPDLIDEIG